MRIGVVDVGTNSCRMLVADYKCSQFKELRRDLKITRLGEGVDRNGFLLDTAAERTISAICSFVKEMKLLGVEEIVINGTSALRDVNNAESLVRRVNEETGCILNIISGYEEARLNYIGVGGTDCNKLIIDIGGGSTEFIWQDNNKEINFKSLNIGSVRMTERFISNPADRVSSEEIALIEREVERLIDNKINVTNIKKAVGLGGTITTIAAIEQNMSEYDISKIEGYKLTFDSLKKTLNKLGKMTLEERKTVKGLQEERADIIIAGIVILSVILNFLELKSVIVSEHDLLYGVLKDMIM